MGLRELYAKRDDFQKYEDQVGAILNQLDIKRAPALERGYRWSKTDQAEYDETDARWNEINDSKWKVREEILKAPIESVKDIREKLSIMISLAEGSGEDFYLKQLLAQVILYIEQTS